jgi:phytol kinase
MNFEWRPDYTALLVSYLYVFAVLVLAELLRRFGKHSADFTRKFVHIGVGMWAVGTALLFRTWYLALIPPVTFVGLNALSYWRGIFRAMESVDRANLGTIFFPLSFAALIFYFWGQPVNLVASLMPMTWGDAMAATTGRRYGQHRYTVGGHTRSVEGSAAMLLWGWIATTLALLVMPYLAGRPPVNWLLALMLGGAVSAACTLVEAVSPWGVDNLTVPVAAAVVLQLLRH